jgi:hypothetical protein
MPSVASIERRALRLRFRSETVFAGQGLAAEVPPPGTAPGPETDLGATAQDAVRSAASVDTAARPARAPRVLCRAGATRAFKRAGAFLTVRFVAAIPALRPAGVIILPSRSGQERVS